MAGRRPTRTWKCRGRHERRDARGRATQGAVAEDAASDRRPALRAHGADEIRQRLSREAARIMAEEGVHDFHAAKRKAADRLNLPDARHLPSNQEIELALAEHLQLFHARQLPQTLQYLRRLALEAMRFLERFEPRLVGSLLTGHVTRFSEIQLHITADSPELVAFFLRDHGIPYEETSKRLRFGGDRSEMVPVYGFLAKDTTIEVSVFSVTSAREAPLSPVDGRPMKRAGLKEVEASLEMA
jgi:hypothetical protein